MQLASSRDHSEALPCDSVPTEGTQQMLAAGESAGEPLPHLLLKGRPPEAQWRLQP